MAWFHTLAVAGGVLLVGGEEVPYTAADLVAGYHQNFARVRTLRVQARYTERWMANQLKHWEKAAARAEQELQAIDLPAEQRALLLEEVQNNRERARDPLMAEPHYTLQDFWTDGVQFQQRVPRIAQGWNTPNPKRDGFIPGTGVPAFPFPDGPATAQNLPTLFRELRIVSYSRSAGFRSWEGVEREGRYGGWVSTEAKGGIVPFPPLGRPPLEWGANLAQSQWHVFDEFFSRPIEEMRVTGTAVLDGRAVYLLEHWKKTARLESFMLPELIEKYGADVERFDVVRAWIDPARGCLPLRMEWTAKTQYKGVPLEPLPGAEKLKPGRVVEEVKVEALAGGGFYPVSGVIRHYAVDADWSGPFATIEDVIERRAVPVARNVLNQETHWEVLKLQANMPLAEDFFALPFPRNTVYYDADEGRGLVTGTAQDYLDGVVGPPGGEIPDESAARPAQRSWWLPWCVGAVVLVCIAWLLRARLRARAAKAAAGEGG